MSVDRSAELSELALIFVQNNMMRITTRNSRLISQIQVELTYKHTRMERERGKNKFVSEATPCYDLSKIPNAVNIVTGAGFLSKIHKMCQRLRVACEVYELPEEEPIEDMLQMPTPLKLQIPRLEWECLRQWQKDAIRYIINYRSGRFQVPTGDGKTTLIAKVCSFAQNYRILVVAKTIDPVLSLYSAAMSEGVNVAIDTSKKKSNLKGDYRVLFTTTGRLPHYQDEVFDLMFGDEIHEHAVSDAVAALVAVQTRRRFGMSGNNKREDGAHKWLEYIYGPLVMEREYQDSLSDGNVVPIYYRAVQTTFSGKVPGTTLISEKDKVLVWRNPERNAMFAKIGHHYLEQGKTVLALVRNTEQALAFRKFFKAPVVVGDITDERAAYFIRNGLMRRDEVGTIQQDGYVTQQRFRAGDIKAVIAGPKWHKAVDLPNLDVVLRMDAMSSIVSNTQIPGRLARKSEGKEYGLLVDALDDFNPALSSRWDARRAHYHKQGWRPFKDRETLF